MQLRLYYANRLVHEYEVLQIQNLPSTISMIGLMFGEEIKQGGILHCEPPFHDRPWYRCDLTPILLEDVPRETRTLQLLLG